uniref:Uncharacterized protein n=1 Tax=Meloidogyne hapla TaxID=6305 RepID=A0A1I8BTP7_MELHA
MRTGIKRRYVEEENTVDSPQDDKMNTFQVAKLLMSLNEFERNSKENLDNGRKLVIALHECYQLCATIPHIFEIELVLEKIEEEGHKGDPSKLLEYFTLDQILSPIWELLVNKSVDAKKLLYFPYDIHSADEFLDKNRETFIKHGNKAIVDFSNSRIKTADMVLSCIKGILKIFENFNDENLDQNSQIVKKGLSDKEKDDLMEKSDLLKKLYNKILPGDKIMPGVNQVIISENWKGFDDMDEFN